MAAPCRRPEGWTTGRSQASTRGLTASRVSGPQHDADLVRQVRLANAASHLVSKGTRHCRRGSRTLRSAIPDLELIHPGVSDLNRETPFGNSTRILSVVVAHLHCAENEGAPGRTASIDHRLSARELLPALVRDERLSARRSAIRGLVRRQLGSTPGPSVCRPHASICGCRQGQPRARQCECRRQ